MPNFEDRIDQLKYNKLKNIIQFIFRNTKIKILIHLEKIIEPKSEDIPTILKENHDDPQSGHSGFHRTYRRIKLYYKWPQMKRTIKNYIKNCESCQKNKTLRKTFRAPMEITSTASQPFEKLCMDVVGPLPLTENGNQYLVTMQDDLTKFSQAYAVQNHTAETVSNVLVKFISHMGIPKTILTDQGTEFLSNTLKEVSKLFHINRIQTTAYHPQSNGAIERSHSTLKDYLKHYVNQNQNDWDNWIPMAIFSFNTAIHSVTKFSPYELVFGSKPILPSSLTKEPEFLYTYDNYVDQLKYRLNKSHEIAKNNILDSKQKSKITYDKKVKNPLYNVGDKVYLENNKSRQCKKLSSNYLGPYEIIEIHDNQNVSLKIKNKIVRIHKNRIKPIS